MPKVSAEHKEAVRRRLLDAARAVLARNGHEDLRTREILAEAGLSAGTLYNYFPSKEDLYEALAEEVVAEDMALFAAQLSPDQDGAGSLVLRILRDFVLARPGQSPGALVHFRGRVTNDPDVAAAVARFNRYIVESFRPLVEQAVDDGVVRRGVDVDALIELLDVVWDGMSRRAAQGTFHTSYDRVGAACFDVLTKGALR